MTAKTNQQVLDMIGRGDTLSTLSFLVDLEADADSALGLNQALYTNGKDARERAEAARVRLLEQLPSLAGNDLAAMVFTLGCIALYQDDVLEAVTRFKEVLALQPGNAMALHNLAYANELLAEFQEARDYYEQALAQNPNQTLTRLNLALLDLADAEYEKSLEVLHALHAVDPGNLGLTLYLCRGLLLRGTTRDLEEVQELTEHTEGALDFLYVRECRANALFLLGETEAAEAAFIQLLEENPDNVFALTGRIKLLAANNAFSELGDYVRRLHALAPSEAMTELLEAVNG